jgi:Xaa-Pro aminopeptidase
MTISNEPGYYEQGAFGIRIENICITVPVDGASLPGGAQSTGPARKFVAFETVTMVPISRKLIDVQRLTEVELAWLNEYHAKVRAVLQPIMERDFPETVAFLIQETEPIAK